MNLASKLWQRGRESLPIEGFYFDRPLVLIQSDDWGRAGLRDREGFEELRSAGLELGERPYDFYTLETAEDLAAIREMMKRHADSNGRHPCIGMNFIVANLDFEKIDLAGLDRTGGDTGSLSLLPLSEGLPKPWSRPNLREGYRAGIADGVFRAALHGSTHFCVPAVTRSAARNSERSKLLLTLWGARTPYIHWRMPWVGYEYWDPELMDEERFLPVEEQRRAIGNSVGLFAKMFAALPRSACAPGYRANRDTHRTWAQHGIRVVQNGPGIAAPPHFDRHEEVLHISRTVEFEPATDERFSMEACVARAERSFEMGIPAIISVHAINFHSTVKDFRSRTLDLLDEFLSALESRRGDLLYLHDEDLYDLVTKGSYCTDTGSVETRVERRKFKKTSLAREG